MEGCRVAVRSDLGGVADLSRAMAEELSGFRGGDLWSRRDALPEPLVDSYEALLAPTGDRLFLVGCIDEVVVGFGIATAETLRDGAVLGTIRELYVEPLAREVGVGELVLGELVEWCRERGCLGIDSMALPGHRATKNFFEEQGFVARSITMHHRFGG